MTEARFLAEVTAAPPPWAQFRTQRARDLAQRDPAAGEVIARFVAALKPLTDEQAETIRRALPPVCAHDTPAAEQATAA